jgi:hypothetical protein
MTWAAYIIATPAALPTGSTAGLAAPLVESLYGGELPTAHGLFVVELFPLLRPACPGATSALLTLASCSTSSRNATGGSSETFGVAGC